MTEHEQSAVEIIVLVLVASVIIALAVLGGQH